MREKKETFVTEVALAIPPGMKHYELPAGEQTLDFWGRLIYAIDNDRGDRPRWAELRLYKILATDPDDEIMYGRQMWLLYTIGHTLVYHARGSECNKGIAVAAGDFRDRAEDWENLEPCEFCHPANWETVDDAQQFELEVTWYSYTPCRSPQEVLDALRREPRCKNCNHKPHDGYRCRDCRCFDYAEGPRPLSVPGRRLIEHVRHLDEDIRRAVDKKVRF